MEKDNRFRVNIWYQEGSRRSIETYLVEDVKVALENFRIERPTADIMSVERKGKDGKWEEI
jgi:hypothetical protein